MKNIDIDIDMVILENIDIDMDFLEYIDIDKGILQSINIAKILYQLEFGISNRAMLQSFVLSDQLVKVALEAPNRGFKDQPMHCNVKQILKK